MSHEPLRMTTSSFDGEGVVDVKYAQRSEVKYLSNLFSNVGLGLNIPAGTKGTLPKSARTREGLDGLPIVKPPYGTWYAATTPRRVEDEVAKFGALRDAFGMFDEGSHGIDDAGDQDLALRVFEFADDLDQREQRVGRRAAVYTGMQIGGRALRLDSAACAFGYRDSVFKHGPDQARGGSRDIALARAVVERDLKLDALHRDIEKKAIRLIRERLGFGGLLLSDDLVMNALSGSLTQRAHKALKAGCDIVIHWNGDMDEMRQVAEGVKTAKVANLKSKVSAEEWQGAVQGK